MQMVPDYSLEPESSIKHKVALVTCHTVNCTVIYVNFVQYIVYVIMLAHCWILISVPEVMASNPLQLDEHE